MRGLARSLLALALLAGCAESPPPVVPLHVLGTEAGALAGTWRGNYLSGSSGRSGTIAFDLDAAEGVARGRVVMTLPPDEAGERRGTEQPAVTLSPLSIRFVAVRDGLVTGALEPYRDPRCGCMVSTVFTGVLAGDVIEGTYVTNGPPDHVPGQGRFRVERTPPHEQR